LACEPRCCYAANQFLLMTASHIAIVEGGEADDAFFAVPANSCREISCCGRQLFLGEGYRDLLHDIAGALSVFEFTAVASGCNFLQTPNDWNSLQFWQAVHTVAYATKTTQLAAEGGLGFSGMSRSGCKGQRGQNAEHAENPGNAIVHHDTPSRVSAQNPDASKAPRASLPQFGAGRKTPQFILVNCAPLPAPL